MQNFPRATNPPSFLTLRSGAHRHVVHVDERNAPKTLIAGTHCILFSFTEDTFCATRRARSCVPSLGRTTARSATTVAEKERTQRATVLSYGPADSQDVPLCFDKLFLLPLTSAERYRHELTNKGTDRIEKQRCTLLHILLHLILYPDLCSSESCVFRL